MKSKKLIGILLCLAMLVTFAGCSERADMSYTKGESSYDVSNGIVYGDAMEAPSQSAGGTGVVVNQNQKLVRNMTIRAQTQDLDPLLSEMEARVRELGGYVENKNVQNYISSGSKTTRNAELTVRIPAQSLDAFVDHIRGQSNVTSLSESVDDITLKYVAVESRIVALETEQQRLLELLEKADNMSDLLQIESRLTDVRTELEQVVSQMRLYDNMVEYATLRLTLTEVREFTEPEEEKTVWQRIGSGLVNSWNILCTALTEFFIVAVVSLPILIPIAVVTVGTIVIVRLASKKKKTRKNPPQEPQANQ